MPSELQLAGRVTLLFKKGDRLSAAQYRPVTVLSADFKALGLVLTNRLRPWMTHLCHPTQTGFIPGRSIFSNISVLRDVLDHARETDVDACILSTDFMKMYDRVSKEGLYEVMTAATGAGYAAWVRVMYTDLHRAIGLGDRDSPPFALARWSPTERKVRPTDTRSTRPKSGTGRALTWRALARAALAPKVLAPQITLAVRGIRPVCRRSGHPPPSSWPIWQRAGEPSERAKRDGAACPAPGKLV